MESKLGIFLAKMSACKTAVTQGNPANCKQVTQERSANSTKGFSKISYVTAFCVFLYINNQDLREIICWKPLFRFWTIYKSLEISYNQVDFKVLPKKGNHSPLNLVFQIKIWRQLPVGGVNVTNASSLLSWRSVKVLRPQSV